MTPDEVGWVKPHARTAAVLAARIAEGDLGISPRPKLLFMARVNGRTPVDLNGRSLYPQSTEQAPELRGGSVDWEGRG